MTGETAAMPGVVAPESAAMDPRTLPPELAALDDRFATSTTEVEVPGGAVRLLHPRNADDLITEADYVLDERLPYWADIWPSSLALARTLNTLIPGPCRALELGCGLGLVTIAALRAGADVVATDYYADALLFTRRNALAATGREPAVRLANWRSWPEDVGRFDVIVASDVLYEKEYPPLLASIIAASLVDGGLAFVADPGRLAYEAFRMECVARELMVVERLKVPYRDGAISQVITIHEIRKRAP